MKTCSTGSLVAFLLAILVFGCATSAGSETAPRRTPNGESKGIARCKASVAFPGGGEGYATKEFTLNFAAPKSETREALPGIPFYAFVSLEAESRGSARFVVGVLEGEARSWAARTLAHGSLRLDGSDAFGVLAFLPEGVVSLSCKL
jgi:hypothetical protein